MTPQDTEAMSHGQARSGSRRALQATTCLAAAWLAALGCGDGMPTMPNPPTGAEFTLSQAQVSAMNTRAGHLADANPGNGSLQSLVDSTLLALQAGVVMKRVDVQTDLTTAPLYFVGLHRVIHQAGGGSFSTWTMISWPSSIRSRMPRLPPSWPGCLSLKNALETSFSGRKPWRSAP